MSQHELDPAVAHNTSASLQTVQQLRFTPFERLTSKPRQA
jgi:hypothetical protein